MKKNILYSTVILLAGLTLGACSSNDSDDTEEPKIEDYTIATVSEAPVWQIDWQSDEASPDWQEPHIHNYENWSIMKVQIEDALKPYTSADDRLAIFVGNECRGVSAPVLILGSTETNTNTYLLKAWGNENNGQQLHTTLKYYNKRLKHVFALSATVTFHVGEDVGVGSDVIPQFTIGSSKYPVTMTYDATALLAKASINPAAGDLLAAFVGNECRGTTRGGTALTVFGRKEGENVTIKYYQAATGRIYSFPDAVRTANEKTTDFVIK